LPSSHSTISSSSLPSLTPSPSSVSTGPGPATEFEPIDDAVPLSELLGDDDNDFPLLLDLPAIHPIHRGYYERLALQEEYSRPPPHPEREIEDAHSRDIEYTGPHPFSLRRFQRLPGIYPLRGWLEDLPGAFVDPHWRRPIFELFEIESDMEEDDFAQSRGADDLFSDDIEAPESPELEHQYYAAPAPAAPAILSTENVRAHNTQQTARPRGQSSYRSRGGAAMRGGHGVTNNNGRRTDGMQGSFNPRADIIPPPAASTPPPNAANTLDSESTTPLSTEPGTSSSVAQAPAAPAAPAAPPQQQQRITSVRGDRSATGPAKPPKRTEEELNALMARMHIKNAEKSQAHARAEKDEAAYQQREALAAKKRTEERQNVRQMNADRAQNRERKLGAISGREWDSEKQEEDIVDSKSRGPSSKYSRGANGGVAGARGVEAGERGVYQGGQIGRGRFGDQGVPSHGVQGRRDPNFDGKGGRGGRGGRGGQAGRNGQAVPADQEFPALPSWATKPRQQQAQPETGSWGGAAATVQMEEAAGGGSWADEVEKEKSQAEQSQAEKSGGSS